jgi:hypothetical protein
MGSDYTPRVVFEITEEQRRRKDFAFPIKGTLRAVMSQVLDDLLDLIEEHGQVIVGLIIDQSIKPRDLIKTLKGAEEVCKDGKFRKLES